MPKNCFVIIGYGKKTSYANGKARLLNLDETYELLIKPVFEELKIDCYRAIDKNLNGSIDEVMLQEIMNADIAIADISALNANVMWELGVRHTLKPHHTIMICEKEQMNSLPFDINRFVVHQYIHSEEGIPYAEVKRFTGYLKKLVQGITDAKTAQNDSPVHQFLKNDFTITNNTQQQAAAQQVAGTETFATVINDAETAKTNTDYATALTLFSKARVFAEENITLRDNLPLIISRQALCTYKLQLPDKKTALENAWKILETLAPEQSFDLEVIGLAGAINKRLNDETNDMIYLDKAISFYEKGFNLKKDPFNGINTAFMLYKKALLLKNSQQDWDDVKLKADYIRNTILDECLALEKQPGFDNNPGAIWTLYTIAEAYHYKSREDKMTEYELKAKDKKNKQADNSYTEQKEKIKQILPSLK